MAENKDPPNPNEAPQKKTDWQPMIDAIAPHAAAFVRDLIENSEKSTATGLRLERWIIWLAFIVVSIAGIAVTVAALRGEFDAAERIVIPLISFAGGLGVGSRLQSRVMARPG